jgi:hypothetical protein
MAETLLRRPLTVQAFWRALVDAGVFSADDAGMICRLVIDVDPDKVAVVMHVERYGDERLLKVAQTLEGIEISQAPATPADEEE